MTYYYKFKIKKKKDLLEVKWIVNSIVDRLRFVDAYVKCC